jgi:hypothetical protein
MSDEQELATVAAAPPDEEELAADGGAPADPRLAELQQRIRAEAGERRRLAERLRAALIATEPAIPAEMVTGETVAEVEASFSAAREALRRMREAVRAEAPPVPAGAPGRAARPHATPFEKIRAGIGRI